MIAIKTDVDNVDLKLNEAEAIQVMNMLRMVDDQIDLEDDDQEFVDRMWSSLDEVV